MGVHVNGNRTDAMSNFGMYPQSSKFIMAMITDGGSRYTGGREDVIAMGYVP